MAVLIVYQYNILTIQNDRTNCLLLFYYLYSGVCTTLHDELHIHAAICREMSSCVISMPPLLSSIERYVTKGTIAANTTPIMIWPLLITGPTGKYEGHVSSTATCVVVKHGNRNAFM